jgi:hypothetical protein
MDIKGKIVQTLPKQTGQGKNGPWEKQEYILETEGQYPKKVCFEIWGADKVSQFAVRDGETVNVSFDLDSREFNGKWYTNVRAWKVDKLGATTPGSTPVNSSNPADIDKQFSEASEDFALNPDTSGDDLPF